ncbi:MAG: hypothetical protein WDZ35_13675 [Crocinitomicaceae bacterium]
MKYNIIILLILSSFFSFSQETIKGSDTLFLDAKWQETEKREDAFYYRETSFNPDDSILFVYDYYLDSQSIQMKGGYHKEMKPFNQHGRFEFYYPTGTLKAVYNYHYGLKHGKLQKYYENGELMSEVNYDMGTQVDTIKTYFKNGQLHKVELINPDFSEKNPSDKFKRTILLTAYDKNGIIQVKNGNGIYTSYFLSGRRKEVIQYENGFIHGKWIQYTGVRKRVSSIMTFKKGRFIKGQLRDNGKKDVFSSLSRDAYFPTGLRGLDKFIQQNTGNCKDGFQNEILVLIHISTEGQVSLEQIIAGNANACQLEELQTLITYMPHWIPAAFDGKYVEGSQILRIDYTQP